MIIDTDVDIDDWLAILYLLNHPEIDVKAISVVGTGACHLQPGTRNALDLLQLAGHPDIPVAMGADRPLDYGHPLRHGGARQGPRVPAQIDPPDYPDGTHVRKASPQGRFSWRGRLWRAGKPFAGRLIGIRPTTTDGTYTVYYRHQLIRTITLP